MITSKFQLHDHIDTVTDAVKASTLSAYRAIRDFIFPFRDESQRHYFARFEIEKYHKLQSDYFDGIDDQTWDDLDLDSLVESISPDTSIFGKQSIHHRLRCGFQEGAVEPTVRRIAELRGNDQFLKKLQGALAPLLESDKEICELLFTEPATPLPSWPKWLWLFQLSALTSVALLWVSVYAAIAIACFALTGIALQTIYYRRLQEWSGLMKTLQGMLNVCAQVSELAHQTGHPALSELIDAGMSVRTIREANASLTHRSALASIPGAAEYASWYLADDIKLYFSSSHAFRKNQELLRKCVRLVSNLEGEVALAVHLSARNVCVATPVDSGVLRFDAVVHPLLPHAVPLTVAVEEKSVFLSGKNGAGKSTVLRTIGTNIAMGQAFGFCYAAAATVPTFRLFTSIRNEDSLSNGESLYMAELRRASELLSAKQQHGRIIALVDEIFRGTNHVESVAGAAAVLNELVENCLVFASSHNLILASLLKQKMTSMCVRRSTDSAQVTLSLGILDQTNGIELIKSFPYPERVEANAQKIARWFENYLAHPDTCPNLLN